MRARIRTTILVLVAALLFVFLLRPLISLWVNYELIGAACSGDLKSMHFALACGANINFREKDETALMCAVQCVRPEAVKELLRLGANPNDQYSGSNATVLMAATEYYDYPEIIRILLKAGANPHLRNSSGMTALDFAIEYKNKRAIELLRGK
jgi:ankyrin repeat protein